MNIRPHVYNCLRRGIPLNDPIQFAIRVGGRGSFLAQSLMRGLLLKLGFAFSTDVDILGHDTAKVNAKYALE